MFPAEPIRNRSVLFVEIANVFAAGKKAPTVEPPVYDNDGAAAEPAPSSSWLVALSQNRLTFEPKALVPAPNGMRPAAKEETPLPPLATGKIPVTPVVSGSPVQFVSVPDVGVPNKGVTSVGDVEKTRFPVPVAPVEVTPSKVTWPETPRLLFKTVAPETVSVPPIDTLPLKVGLARM